MTDNLKRLDIDEAKFYSNIPVNQIPLYKDRLCYLLNHPRNFSLIVSGNILDLTKAGVFFFPKGAVGIFLRNTNMEFKIAGEVEELRVFALEHNIYDINGRIFVNKNNQDELYFLFGPDVNSTVCQLIQEVDNLKKEIKSLKALFGDVTYIKEETG